MLTPIPLTPAEFSWFRASRWRCFFCEAVAAFRVPGKLLCEVCATLPPDEARRYAETPKAAWLR